MTTPWLVPSAWLDTLPVGQPMLNRLSTDLNVLSTRTLAGKATDSVTMTTTWQEIPGTTVTIVVPGYYRIKGVFHLSYNTADGFADDAWELYGGLSVSTIDPPEQPQIAIFKAINPYGMAVRQQWLLSLPADAELKLITKKQGGKGGSSSRETNTLLTATLRGRG